MLGEFLPDSDIRWILTVLHCLYNKKIPYKIYADIKEDMPIRGFDPHYYYYIGDYLIKKLDLRQDINEDEFVSKTAYNTQMRDQMGFLIYKSNGSEGIGHHGFELKEQDKKNS